MSEQELHDKTNALVSEVLDMIAEDAEFREALKVDPMLAMDTAGFSAKIDALVDEVEADTEVSGFATIAPTIGGLSAFDLKNTTLVASNTGSGGCCGATDSGAVNRFLPGFDFSRWG